MIQTETETETETETGWWSEEKWLASSVVHHLLCHVAFDGKLSHFLFPLPLVVPQPIERTLEKGHEKDWMIPTENGKRLRSWLISW